MSIRKSLRRTFGPLLTRLGLVTDVARKTLDAHLCTICRVLHSLANFICLTETMPAARQSRARRLFIGFFSIEVFSFTISESSHYQCHKYFPNTVLELFLDGQTCPYQKPRI
jgi:hypothetical protein